MTDSSDTLPSIVQVAGDSTSRLAGKVAIITGCNSPIGIGRAAAAQFARNGVKALYICDWNDEHLLAQKAELERQYRGVKVYVRQFDAADEEAVDEIVNEAVREHGRLDVFFANAGVADGTHFEHISSDSFMDVMKINALSVFLAAKFAARAMRKTSGDKPHSQGSIIATSSLAGIRSNAGSTSYSASKAAVVSLVQTIAYQLAGTNIRCNAICPGIVETGMTAPVYESARVRGTVKKIGQINPLKRGAVADEIARVALFLASDEASYVNGQAWSVCGGLSAGHPYVMGKLA